MQNSHCRCLCSAPFWNLEKLDKDTGEIIWRKPLPHKRKQPGNITSNLFTLDSGNLLAVTALGLTVFDPDANEILYEGGIHIKFHGGLSPVLDANAGFQPMQTARVVLHDSTIIVGTGGPVVCYDEELNEQWRVTAIDGITLIQPFVAMHGSDLIVVNSSFHTCSQLDASDGSPGEFSNLPIGVWSPTPFHEFNVYGNTVNAIAGGYLWMSGFRYATPEKVTYTDAGVDHDYVQLNYIINPGPNIQVCDFDSDNVLLWVGGEYKLRIFDPLTALDSNTGSQFVLGANLHPTYNPPTVTGMHKTSNGDILVMGYNGNMTTEPKPIGSSLTTDVATDIANVWCFDADGSLKWYHSQRDEYAVTPQLLGSAPSWATPSKTGMCENDEGYYFTGFMHSDAVEWRSRVAINTKTVSDGTVS